MSKKYNINQILNFVTGIFMSTMLLSTLLPYFINLGGETLSIQQYVWFPTNHENFKAYLTETLANYNINDAVFEPVMMLMLGLIGILLCFLKSKSVFSLITPFFWSIFGIVSYTNSSFLKLGSGYGLHVVLIFIVLIICLIHLCVVMSQYKSRKKSAASRLAI